MKMRKLLPIAALLLASILFLASCGGPSFNKKEVKLFREKDTHTATALTGLDGYTLEDVEMSGAGVGVGVWVKNDATGAHYRVINLGTMQDIKTISYTAADYAELLLTAGNQPVRIEQSVLEVTLLQEGKLTYTYYTPTGQAIGQATETRAVFASDCMQIGSTVYRLDEDTLEVKESYARSELLSPIRGAMAWNEDYYYWYDDEGLVVFDNELCHQFTYQIPADAVEGAFHVFSDGYIVVQYCFRLPESEAEYDFLWEMQKYDLVTLRINPKNGKMQELDTEYCITDVAQRGSGELDWIKVSDTLVQAYRIEDRRLAANPDYDLLWLDLDSRLKGSPVMELEGEHVMVLHYGGGYVVLQDPVGRKLLYRANGKYIDEVTGATAFTEKYMVTEDAIYNYDIEKLTALRVSGDATALTYVTGVGSKLIFRSGNAVGTHYIFDGTRNEQGDMFRMLTDAENFVRLGDLYGIKDVSGNYTYFDAAGNTLFVSYTKAASVESSSAGQGADGDWTLVETYAQDGTTRYFIVR